VEEGALMKVIARISGCVLWGLYGGAAMAVEGKSLGLHLAVYIGGMIILLFVASPLLSFGFKEIE
jgi:hypothetical protein